MASGELGFSVGGEIKLKARVSKQIAIHLEERPLHDNQTLSENNDGSWLLESTAQIPMNCAGGC